jgi:hypothetical protein
VELKVCKILQRLCSEYADLGSPVHSLNFFRAILDEFDTTRFVLAARNSQVIGGGLCLYFRDTVLVPWASSLRPFSL